MKPLESTGSTSEKTWGFTSLYFDAVEGEVSNRQERIQGTETPGFFLCSDGKDGDWVNRQPSSQNCKFSCFLLHVFNCRNPPASCSSAFLDFLWSLSSCTLISHHFLVGVDRPVFNVSSTVHYWKKLSEQLFVCYQIDDRERSDLLRRAVASRTAQIKKQQWDMLNNIYVSFVFSDSLGWQWIVSSYINLPTMNSSQWAWTFSG